MFGMRFLGNHLSVRETKTAIDLAEEIKELLDVNYADAETVILI